MSSAPQERLLRSGAALGALALCCLFPLLPAFFLQGRKGGNEVGVINQLKAVAYAQAIYRDGDMDGNGTLEFAPALSCLINTGPGRDQDLIVEVLGFGLRSGYVFAITSASADGFTAIASPVEPGETGDRYFGINSRGQVFFSHTGPVSFHSDGSSCDMKLGQ